MQEIIDFTKYLLENLGFDRTLVLIFIGKELWMLRLAQKQREKDLEFKLSDYKAKVQIRDALRELRKAIR